jgi:hypothetical protein
VQIQHPTAELGSFRNLAPEDAQDPIRPRRAPATRPFPAPAQPSPASIGCAILTKKYRLAKLVSAHSLGV